MKYLTRLAAMGPYLTRLPKAAPSGEVVLVHNSVRPTRVLGMRGFRAWLQRPDTRLEVCDCGWAPELGTHFYVRPPNEGAAPPKEKGLAAKQDPKLINLAKSTSCDSRGQARSCLIETPLARYLRMTRAAK
jgi:hypothetical protein